MSTRSTLEFLRTETGAGLLLVLAAAVAILWANSPWAGGYAEFVGYPIAVQFGPFGEIKSLAEWVKSGLMPIFFFVVGLGIKNEVLRGELSNPRRLALPLVAALGGLIVPAAIYLALNVGPSGAPAGWPTSAATDIAFALAALSLAGARLPATLRIFLLTLALASDVAAVLLVAVLFIHDLRPWMLGGAVATLGVLAGMSRWRTAPYVFWAVGFLLLWAFTLKSGVNTSIAGVLAAFCVPLEAKRPGGDGVLEEMLEALHPYVAFFILPMFALTAAGFSFADLPTQIGPVTAGVALALFLGKQIGVFGATALVIGLKWARRPMGAKWLELYGVSLLCGAGFSMSLYIGGQAFAASDTGLHAQVRLGIVAGSILSAVVGMAVLAWCQNRRTYD
jgi:NhaA family Na+:H+ antiporter